MPRRVVAALAALAVLAGAPAAAEPPRPSQWPQELALGSAPNAIRYGGTDRYQTSLAGALALRGGGGFPFDTPDRTSGGAASLAAADGWWGAATCPGSVIVVAGDVAADALAAAPLSDPTDGSDEPRLQRVAAGDPLFDPVGGFDRVDTFAAPIIVTTSARAGARGLAAPARLAVSDLRAGGCTSAREAIIVGGTAAVPVEVEAELVSLGFEEVFRVAGTDRFDTAARIATAMGTEPVPAGAACADERADDGRTAMGFHGNAVIEYRADARTCTLHGRAVVLAEGRVGADALAAGWWTSYWQVPVLFTDGDGSLPAATRTALQTLAIDTIVVLGGVGRIPEETVEQAATLAGALPGRFFGPDRYATSVEMARSFGGWHPTANAADFEADRLCLAASSGAAQGWPDALTAGPLCGRLSAQRSARPSPTRVLEPVEDGGAPVAMPAPAHDATPVLLVPAGEPGVPDAVAAFLSASFLASGGWCRGAVTTGCTAPGFGVVLGGPAAVADGVVERVSGLVAGGDVAQERTSPALVAPFRTALDLAPVYDVEDGQEVAACAERATIANARWLAAYRGTALGAFIGARDLAGAAAYAEDLSAPVCVGLGPPDEAATVVALAVDGSASGAVVLGAGAAVTMAAPMQHGGPIATDGDPGTATGPGAQTTWRFRDAPPGPLPLQVGGASRSVAEATVEIVLTRAADRVHFVATVEVADGADGVRAAVRGEATLVGGRWELAGRAEAGGGAGGFRGSLATNGTGANGDDLLEWRLDAYGP